MQSAEVIEFPKRNTSDGPHFIAWRYDRGEVSVYIEGFGEQTDGEMPFSWSPKVGVDRSAHCPSALRRTLDAPRPRRPPHGAC
jgi:hypothetical protein